jgi:phosphoribosylglycinamide formyltransferase-1
MAASDISGAYRLGILASGGGTNLQAVLDRCMSGALSAEVAVVISNNSGSGALKRARNAGIPSFHLSGWTHPGEGELDLAIRDTLKTHTVDLVVLAGYMKKLGPAVLGAFPNRIVNTHPALLPSFGGRGMYGSRVQAAVLQSGARETGVTVHLVDEEYDQGPVVAQVKVPVMDGDTSESLAARVLSAEHQFYPETIGLFAENRVVVEGGRVTILDS